jgi:hypothetical protein
MPPFLIVVEKFLRYFKDPLFQVGPACWQAGSFGLSFNDAAYPERESTERTLRHPQMVYGPLEEREPFNKEMKI